MSDEKPKNKDGQDNRPGGGTPEPQTDDRIVDGRLDPDAQSPDDEHAKPFDPRENDPT